MAFEPFAWVGQPAAQALAPSPITIDLAQLSHRLERAGREALVIDMVAARLRQATSSTPDLEAIKQVYIDADLGHIIGSR